MTGRRPGKSCTGTWTAPGFSLIELLVVVAVVAVLLAILLPALAAARRSAQRTAQTAGVRSLGLMIAAYSQDFGGAFPYLMTPGRPELGFFQVRGWRLDGGEHSYFAGSKYFWPTVAMPEFAEAPPGFLIYDNEFGYWSQVPNQQSASPCPIYKSLAFMTAATAADPKFWRDSEPDAAWCVGMKFSGVRYPSAKGLLLDVHAESLTLESEDPEALWMLPLVAMMDGSAGFRALPPDSWEDRVIADRPWGHLPWPIISTRDGVYGRDF